MSDQSGFNPFDIATPNEVPETPHLEDVMRLGMRACAMGLRVAMPCAVVAVRGNQLVDVQPLLQAQYVVQDAPTTLHPIPNVLVSMPMGRDYSVKLPIAVGDTGLCIFADRSLDVWAASSGGVVNPADGRHHDLMDAVFVPGLVPMGGQTKDATQDLVLTNGLAQVRLQKGGQFQITNGPSELLDLVSQLLALHLQLLNQLPSIAVTVPTGAELLANLTTTATKISTALTTLKG